MDLQAITQALNEMRKNIKNYKEGVNTNSGVVFERESKSNYYIITLNIIIYCINLII